MTIMALLAASVYAIASSSISASRTAMDQQLTLRRLDAFLRLTRGAFLNLPSSGTVFLQQGRSPGGEPEQQLVIGRAQGLFGLPSLGGGSLVLASRACADGTRTITMIRLPPNVRAPRTAQILTSRGIPLLPGVRKPRWSIYSNETWHDEWPEGSSRPQLVRLQMQIEQLPDPVEGIFYVPPSMSPPTVPQVSVSPPTSGATQTTP